MSSSFIQRGVSFGLSLVLTLAMLGSIDRLAQQPDVAAPGWAKDTPARTARA